ncbi:unnamed protein product [Microthlaspi erraticum]|uniref:DUF3444 domain-containing protein n=1 Tax=Microthlaspi erraticum TaxID=1685480 RepID=A0A6D2LNH0_9BRAS|nr:unnamed protein product [Microthlaspi erraticum]
MILEANAVMEKTNLDGAQELPPQTFSHAPNTGEKRKREGLVRKEGEAGNSSENEEVILVGDTKVIKAFGIDGGEQSQRSVFSKRQAFDAQINRNRKGSLVKEEAREEPERAKQDSTFNDFDKLREGSSFAVGQTWALYDTDGMPRLYAHITKVSAPGFELSVTWLEPDPDVKEEIQRYDEDLPVSVGRFKLGKTEDIKDQRRFSHVVHCNEGSSAGTFSVYPRKGETWAIVKGRYKSICRYLDIDWSADPDSHWKYNYAFVEIVSEYPDRSLHKPKGFPGVPVVPVGFLHKAKGFSSVFCRFNKEVVPSYILRGGTEQFSHRVPSFKTTGIEAEGVPRDAYELDPAALPENIKEIDVPLHLLIEPAVGEDYLPRHYGKIQKITFIQAFDQDPVVKLHIGRLKARAIKGVIQWIDKDMPFGCGNFRAKKVLEIFTDLSVFTRQISTEATGDGGNDFSIMPKTGDVWAIYRNWSRAIEVVDLKSETYDLVEVLDDKVDYKVLLLAPEGGFKVADSAGFGSVYMAATEHWIDGADLRFTIPKSELLRFSHQVPTSKVTEEVHGAVKEVYECVGLKFNDFEKLREEANFAVGQIWALYGTADGVPRKYALIRKVSIPSFGLRITYLEPDPDGEKEIQWFEQDLPVSAGKFRLGKSQNVTDRSIFSHDIDCNEGSNTGHIIVSPRKGETWAIFKNWDINWSSEPDSHRKCEHEFVEVLSDYADGAGVSVSFLHKAKGFASVFFRMGFGDADIFRVSPHSLYRFSHSVPSIRLTGTEGKGVPKDSYELDQAALPETIEDMMVPSHILPGPTVSKPQTVYFVSKGNVFQPGQIWSFCCGHEYPLYYGRIQKITFTQEHEQEAVYKLHVNRLKATRFSLDVIQYDDKEMPVGCGTFHARKVVETITSDDVSLQIVPETSTDGNEYTILPKIDDVWVIYRFWSEYREFRKVGLCSYDVVQVLDDTMDYKVLLLERESSSDDDEENILFREVKEYKSNEIEGSEPIFTIPNSERLRFSHKVPASRVTKEIHGVVKDLIEVDAGALPYNVTHPDLRGFC